MIVAVEGPSAAGKTTWCSRQGWPVVGEYAPTGREPDGSDECRSAAYWTEVNSRRWRQAVEREQNSAVVLCDSDPLKLHYSWCLARIGAAPWARFDEEFRHVRRAFERRRLGLADLVVVSIPSRSVLDGHRAAAPSRRRRSFELHARLAGPLREWFEAVDRVEAGLVRWSFPEDVTAPPVARRDRSDVSLLDAVMTGLPGRD